VRALSRQQVLVEQRLGETHCLLPWLGFWLIKSEKYVRTSEDEDTYN
jgi:hypothetical protein